MKFNITTGKFEPIQRVPNQIINTPTNMKLKHYQYTFRNKTHPAKAPYLSKSSFSERNLKE